MLKVLSSVLSNRPLSEKQSFEDTFPTIVLLENPTKIHLKSLMLSTQGSLDLTSNARYAVKGNLTSIVYTCTGCMYFPVSEIQS